MLVHMQQGKRQIKSLLGLCILKPILLPSHFVTDGIDAVRERGLLASSTKVRILSLLTSMSRSCALKSSASCTVAPGL